MPRRRASVVLVVSAGALGAAVVASAASLGLVPARLTSYDAASSIAATTCTLTSPVADAYVDGALLLMNTNFGSSLDLQVRSSTVGNRRSFVRFDLSSCAIPAAARVTQAVVTLYLSQAPGSSRTYEIRRLTASWVEGTVTFANQPAAAGGATSATMTGTTSGVTLTWPVTSDAQAFVAGTATNNGWRVVDSAEGALVAIDSTFGARERATASERPKLVVTYYP
jgi:hypothetical protein